MSELLKVRNLTVHFNSAEPDRFAVNHICFSAESGEIVGLVGESGSGKTVTAMCMSGLLSRAKAEITGSITVDGAEILNLPEKELLTILGKEIAVVFQEPMTAMNPVMKIGPQVEESLRLHTKLSAAERKAAALEAMAMADLPDPERVYRSYPHELSGGMLQRAMIAAAIISRPKLLLADEPTTALDVTVQAQILDLIKRLNRETGMTVLFISHDLHVVRKLCSKVVVMQRGKVVEENTVEEIFRNPQHEYTKNLLAAIPDRSHRLV